MSSLYIYGVVSTATPLTFNGHGLAGGLRVIGEDGAGAIVGHAPDCDLATLPREQAVTFLLRHQEALDEAMAQTTVLPVKFGTIAPEEDAVRHVLILGKDTLDACLTEFTDHLQMEVAVLWRLDQVFAEIATEHDIARLRETTQVSDGEEGSARLEQAVKAALERRRAALADEVCDVLGTVATEIATAPLPNDQMAANVALLLNKTDMGSLEGMLNRLDAEMAGEVKFRATGPLPPSSFATLEITFPPSGTIDWLADASAAADIVMINVIRQQMQSPSSSASHQESAA